MTTTTSTEPMLVLTDIAKTYPGVRALSDVSVSAARGRVHAILGENGAGKSTLVGIAAGSVVPDSGTIGLDGETFTRVQPRVGEERQPVGGGAAQAREGEALVPRAQAGRFQSAGELDAPVLASEHGEHRANVII